jgi:hypothetical protein
MRGARVLKLAIIALGAGMVGAVAAPSGPTEFDGSWFVRVVSESGPCNGSYALPIEVSNGLVSDFGGLFGAQATGSVDSAGVLKVSISHEQNIVEATGALRGRTGAGVWKSQPVACAGQWMAEKL